jgi:hypothetical protein
MFKLLFPDVRVLPPVNNEMQHCCIISEVKLGFEPDRCAGDRRRALPRPAVDDAGPTASAAPMSLGESTSAFAEKPVTTHPVRCT